MNLIARVIYPYLIITCNYFLHPAQQWIFLQTHKYLIYSQALLAQNNHPRAILKPLKQVRPVLKIQFKRKGSWVNVRRPWPPTFFPKFGHNRPLILTHSPQHILRFKKHLFYHSLLVMPLLSKPSRPIVPRLVNLRPLNWYTLRGIRTARYTLQRRQGKVSQYKHLKSKIF